jgi:hypothetical protein
LLLYGGEALFRVGDDAADVLRADGEADGVPADARRPLFVSGDSIHGSAPFVQYPVCMPGYRFGL